MELVNQTPLAARADVADIGEAVPRIGVITAKATYRWSDRGTEIDSQEPLPLFEADVPHELGVIPNDSQFRRGNEFEVMLLGAAYAPKGKRVPFLKVRMAVGRVAHELIVVGDRRWQSNKPSADFTEPTPFERMPMHWNLTHGGKAEAYLDPKNHVEVADAWNPNGKGFDAEGHARGAAAGWGAADGFPIVPNYERILPNLEHPARMLKRPGDTAEPYCWAPMPMELPYRMFKVVRDLERRSQEGRPPDYDQAREKAIEEFGQAQNANLDAMLFRAHPDWILPQAPGATELELSGLSATSPSMRVSLPMTPVVADVNVAGRTGVLPLIPQALLIFSEEQRFTLVYRATFSVAAPSEEERSFRLRLGA